MKRYNLEIDGLQYGDPYIEIEENDNGEYIKYSDFYDWIQKRSAMCEANSNAVLADVLADIQKKYQSITGHALIDTSWLEEVLSKYFS